MRLLLIRHAQSVANSKRLLIADAADDLTECGRQQARNLGQQLQKVTIDRVFCSTWNRAASTAKLVFPKQVADFQFDERLVETCPGVFSHWTEHQFLSKFPTFHHNIDNVYEGGESHSQMATRVRDWVETEVAPYKKESCTIVAVSHGGPISIVIQTLLGIDFRSRYPSFMVDNASISEFEWNEFHSRFIASYINRQHSP